MDLPEHIASTMRLDPSHRALQYDGFWHTWGQVKQQADRLDVCLSEAPRAPVGVVIRNRPALIAALLALLSQRRGIAVLNPILPDAGLVESLHRLGPAAVVMLDEDLSRPGVKDAVESLGALTISLSPDVGPVDVVHPVHSRRRRLLHHA
jgi:acyl-CoA synthetase (AMP-forming)/AMP-acid ligase II